MIVATAQNRKTLLTACLIALAGLIAGCGASPPVSAPESEAIMSAFEPNRTGDPA